VVSVLFGVLVVCSTPAVNYLAVRTLEGPFEPLAKRPADVEAIVVLGGALAHPDGPELATDSLKRCVHAAEVYRLGPPCPVLVSGGKIDPGFHGPPLACLMRDFLLRLGVRPSDVIVEDASLTTYENAAGCRKLLRQRRLSKVVLVTDAIHMRRAAACFRKEGIEVVPAPCHYRAEWDGWTTALVPNPMAAGGCHKAAHEWIGILWYRLRGWL
jgi:uncharacterized SAM-binding protein YcdF (DUF218 family)